MGRPGFVITWPSFIHVRPPTVSGASIWASRSSNSCSPSPRQTKSTSGHCELDEAGIQTGEHPAERELDRGVGGADLPGENLGIRIAGRTQEAGDPRAPVSAV